MLTEDLKLKCAARTDIGLIRHRNEDSLWVDAALGWLLLADGMGGHTSGDLASALAVNHILSRLRDAQEKGFTKYDVAVLLAKSVTEANTAIRNVSMQSDGVAPAMMGSTFVGGVLEQDKITYAHVGDSRLYLLRDGFLAPLTHDHTLVQEFVDAGRLSAEAAQVHPYRGLLTRGLGVHEEVEPDVGICTLHPGDRLLLCTDGLTDMVSEEEIGRLLGLDLEADEIAECLIEAAKYAGGRDNISVIVAWFTEQLPCNNDQCADEAHCDINQMDASHA
ncbi:MAG: protein phosphatase 2C domain-containing protein [Azoarcus sp.]|nr:protein phosphatase 2C domain-containing protein [Azoarcus sp.]